MLLAQVNSRAGCLNISGANILEGMKNRKPLEQWQKDDAARLQRAWHAFSKENNWSQMDLAHACDWKTQGAVNQYLLGKIPLNWPALMKLCRALGVNPRDISPTLANEYGSYSGASQPQKWSPEMS